MTALTKAGLRGQIREQLQQANTSDRALWSSQARARLQEQRIWKEAQNILFFASLPSEPDLWPLLELALQEGRMVALPRFDPAANRYAACRIQNASADLAPGRFGIREPSGSCALTDLNRLDLVLVPGVAFDLHGRRLGRGGGFYDRLLAEVRGLKCGVAFDPQIVPTIPVEPHDVHLNCILTPTRWLEFGSW